MSTLFVGDWVGEFGWEVCAWNGYVRKYVQENFFDRVVVGIRAGHQLLYDDFASGYRIHSMTGKQSIVHLNGKIPVAEFDGEEVSYLRPTLEVCTGAAFDISKQVPRKFGVSVEDRFDILINARNRGVRPDYNWPTDNWNKLVEAVPGVRIGSVGSMGQSLHIEGTVDLRDTPLKDLADLMASAKVLLSPSSGVAVFSSFCGCPHIVWCDAAKRYGGKTIEERFNTYWNPFNTENSVLTEKGFQPDVSTVFTAISERGYL